MNSLIVWASSAVRLCMTAWEFAMELFFPIVLAFAMGQAFPTVLAFAMGRV